MNNTNQGTCSSSTNRISSNIYQGHHSALQAQAKSFINSSIAQVEDKENKREYTNRNNQPLAAQQVMQNILKRSKTSDPSKVPLR